MTADQHFDLLHARTEWSPDGFGTPNARRWVEAVDRAWQAGVGWYRNLPPDKRATVRWTLVVDGGRA